ncbi:MAG: NAD-dependent epimerase/dehydratase family protein [Flavobacteriales bacterium]
MNLVTGANGLVGSHLLVELAKRNKPTVALLRNENSFGAIENLFQFYFPLDFKEKLALIEVRVADIANIPSLEDGFNEIDTVYHAAAVVSFQKKHRDLLSKINIEGTANVVNICLDKGIKKLAFVSSTAALGRSKNGEWVTEKTKWRNSKQNSFYAISKFCAEREVWRGAEEGLSVSIVNPSVIIGPGDYTRSSGKLFSAVKKGMKYYTEGVNGFVDVRDVANLLIEITERGLTNDRFILASENKTYKELFTIIANALNANPPKVKATKIMLKLAVFFEWLKSLFTGMDPLVTSETSRNALNSTFYNNEKIKKQLNFDFTPVEKAVLHTAKHFLKT